MADNPLKKDKVRHWMYSVLGLRVIARGLKPLVTTKLKGFHSDMKQKVQFSCGIPMYNCQACTMETLSINHSGTCPHKCKKYCLCTNRRGGKRVTCKQNNACGQMYEFIIVEHVANSPNWGQTDVTKWSIDPFAVATCFTSSRKGLEELEITSLIDLCLNIKSITQEFEKSTQDLLLTVRKIRNDVFHSGEMEISKQQLHDYLGQMKTLLDSISSAEKENGLENAKKEIDDLLAGNWFLVDQELKDAYKEIHNAFSDDIQRLKVHIESKPTEEEMEVMNKRFEHLNEIFDQQTASHTAQYIAISIRVDSLEQDHRSLNRKVTGLAESFGKLLVHLNNPDLKNMVQSTVELTMELSETPDGRHAEILDSAELRLKACTKAEKSEDLSTEMSEEKDIVETLSKGKDLECVKKKSIALTFRCRTLSSLVSLLQDCVSGKLTERFSPFAKSLAQQFNLPNLSLGVYIYENELQTCLNNVNKCVMDLVTKMETTETLKEEDFLRYVLDFAAEQSREVLPKFFPFVEEEIDKTFVDPEIVYNGKCGTVEKIGHLLLQNRNDKTSNTLTLEGEQGIGKTIICKKILLSWCQTNRKETSLNNMTVEMNKFTEVLKDSLKQFKYCMFFQWSDDTTPKHIDEEMLALQVRQDARETFRKLLSERPDDFLFILDCGTDPVSVKCNPFIIITKRTQIYDADFASDAKTVGVKGFRRPKLQQLVKNISRQLFSESEDDANAFLSDFLNTESMQNPRSFTRNPLICKYFVYALYLRRNQPNSNLIISDHNIEISNIKLSHTQVALLRTLPLHLYNTGVKIDGFQSEPDDECGCSVLGPEYGRWNVFIKEMKITHSSNPLRHSMRCPYLERFHFVNSTSFSHVIDTLEYSSPVLRSLTLERIEITHSEATRLLCNIESLTEVFFKDVNARKDDKICECCTHFTYEHKMIIESLVIDNSDQVLCHIALAPNLKQLQLKNVKVTHNILELARTNAYQVLYSLVLDGLRLSHAEIASLLCKIPTLKEVSLKKITTYHDNECNCESGSKNTLDMNNVEFLQVQASKGVMNLIDSAVKLKTLHLHQWDSVKKILKITIRSSLLHHVSIDVDQISHTEATYLLCAIESLRHLAIYTKVCVIGPSCGCRVRSSRKKDQCEMHSKLVPKHLHVNSVACLTHVNNATSLNKLTVHGLVIKQDEASILVKLLENARTDFFLTFNGTECSIQLLKMIMHSLRANKATIELLNVVVTSATDIAMLVEDTPPFILIGHTMAAYKAAEGEKPRLCIEKATISCEPKKPQRPTQ
ncbi:uncharacterized protein LOC128234215 isoform X2 [Mya arenaria]|uniref:uncharacterized protein LOC128234215 isoform X2 n=1 Tax=Mya arenaria TaxID=6604 RepID=UPI0022E137FB|nr:uncharacterized protein LOC128234215 isoform X2 [Mya arenaria]